MPALVISTRFFSGVEAVLSSAAAPCFLEHQRRNELILEQLLVRVALEDRLLVLRSDRGDVRIPASAAGCRDRLCGCRMPPARTAPPAPPPSPPQQIRVAPVPRSPCRVTHRHEAGFSPRGLQSLPGSIGCLRVRACPSLGPAAASARASPYRPRRLRGRRFEPPASDGDANGNQDDDEKGGRL